MRETRSIGEAMIKDNREPSEVVHYYTFSGKEDLEDDGGFPEQLKENDNTCAKICGIRRQIRIDDMGRFINPNGMYKQKIKQNRWVTVSQKVFNSYMHFLRTKKQSYLLHAEREAMNG